MSQEPSQAGEMQLQGALVTQTGADGAGHTAKTRDDGKSLLWYVRGLRPKASDSWQGSAPDLAQVCYTVLHHLLGTSYVLTASQQWRSSFRELCFRFRFRLSPESGQPPSCGSTPQHRRESVSPLSSHITEVRRCHNELLWEVRLMN